MSNQVQSGMFPSFTVSRTEHSTETVGFRVNPFVDGAELSTFDNGRPVSTISLDKVPSLEESVQPRGVRGAAKKAGEAASRAVTGIKGIPGRVKTAVGEGIDGLGHRISNIFKPESFINNSDYSSDYTPRVRNGHYANEAGERVSSAEDAEKVLRSDTRVEEARNLATLEQMVGATFSKAGLQTRFFVQRHAKYKTENRVKTLVTPGMYTREEYDNLRNEIATKKLAFQRDQRKAAKARGENPGNHFVIETGDRGVLVDKDAALYFADDVLKKINDRYSDFDIAELQQSLKLNKRSLEILKGIQDGSMVLLYHTQTEENGSTTRLNGNKAIDAKMQKAGGLKKLGFSIVNDARMAWNLVAQVEKGAMGVLQLPFSLTGTIGSILEKPITLAAGVVSLGLKGILVPAAFATIIAARIFGFATLGLFAAVLGIPLVIGKSLRDKQIEANHGKENFNVNARIIQQQAQLLTILEEKAIRGASTDPRLKTLLGEIQGPRYEGTMQERAMPCQELRKILADEHGQAMKDDEGNWMYHADGKEFLFESTKNIAVLVDAQGNLVEDGQGNPITDENMIGKRKTDNQGNKILGAKALLHRRAKELGIEINAKFGVKGQTFGGKKIEAEKFAAMMADISKVKAIAKDTPNKGKQLIEFTNAVIAQIRDYTPAVKTTERNAEGKDVTTVTRAGTYSEAVLNQYRTKTEKKHAEITKDIREKRAKRNVERAAAQLKKQARAVTKTTKAKRKTVDRTSTENKPSFLRRVFTRRSSTTQRESIV